MKKVLCMLLTALLVCSVMPLAGSAAKPARPDFSMFVNGSEPVDYSAPSANDGIPSLRGDSELPESFSLRDEGLLPPVRNQGGYGTCWTFGTLGAAESNLIMKGIADKDKINTSELQYIYYCYGEPVDPLGNYTGDHAYRLDGELFSGGNPVYACNALARWTGLADEDVIPYADAEFASVYKYADEFATDMNEYNMEGYRAINIGDRDLVKKCLMEIGGCACSYFSDDNYYSYNEEAYYSDSHKGDTNHTVMIVGWDDNYPKSNFDGNAMPANDGAWLIRNSWGTWNHDGGYFWMSYEESSLDDTVFAFDMNTSDNFDYNYQYDGGEYTATIRTDGLANVFTANSDELLKAVSIVFTKDTYVNYSVDIYVDPTGTDFINTDKPVAAAHTEGTTKFAGMYTVRLASPVALKAGDRFAVVINAETASGAPVSMAYDKTYTGSDWFCSRTVYEPCEGYYISGGVLKDMASRGTPRVKAFTDTAGLPNPEALEATRKSSVVSLTWNAVDGADSYEIWFGTDNGGYEMIGTTADTVYTHTPSDGLLAKYKIKAVKGGEKSIFSKTEAIRLPDLGLADISIADLTLGEYESKAPAVSFGGLANDKAVAFTVADNSIARVEKDGTVTGLKAGETTITALARCDGSEATAKLTVTPHIHNFIDFEEKAATCTQDGMTAFVACELCGEVLTPGEVIPATGHGEAYVSLIASPATCTDEGWTEETKCSVCGAVLTASENIPATGHTEKTVTQAKAATCTEDGNTAEIVCEVCETVLQKSETVGKLGHDEIVSLEAVAPTCTAAGRTQEISCARCGKVLTKSEDRPALGHDPMVTKEAKPATCTTGGYTAESVCLRCEKILTYSNPVYAKGHTPVITKAAAASTCTVKGNTAEISCEVCRVVLTESEELPLIAHRSVLSKAAKAATCTEDGNTEEYKCSECGTVLVESTVIGNKGGHIPQTTLTAAAASCTTAGRTEEVKCGVCGEIITASESIPAKGHKLTGETTAPGCTTKGYTVYTCSECGYRMTSDYVAALGHTDADADGLCDLCGKSVSSGQTDGGDDGSVGFLDRIRDFFRRIIDFFRNLFN